MAQTTAAADDFAETSDGLANSQRILDAQVKDLQAQFGQFLLPVVQELTSFASSNLIPIFEKVFKIFDDGVVTVGEIKRQLFLLGVPASALDYVFGELLPGIVAVSTELCSKFAPVLQNIASQVMPFLNEQIEKFSAWFVENSPLIAETATTIGTALAAAFAFFADNILPFLLTGLGGLIDLILGLATAMMEFINGDWQSGLAALAEIPFVAVWIKNFQQLITMMKLLGTKVVGEFTKIGGARPEDPLLPP